MADDPTIPATDPTSAPVVVSQNGAVAVPTTFLIRVFGVTVVVSLVMMGSIAVLALFYPPQEWQLVNTVITNLKEVTIIALSALGALATGSAATTIMQSKIPAPRPPAPTS